LQWDAGNAEEVRTFIEFGTATDIYTWGQKHADVKLYQTTSSPNPKSINFQSCKSFYCHPSFNQDPDPVPFVFLSENTFHQELLKRRTVKPWPNMIGFCVNNLENETELYHLNDEFGLYANSWSKFPIKDKVRWSELDSISRINTQKLVDGYQYPPKFEANHEYLPIKSLVDRVQSSIADCIATEPQSIQLKCEFDRIETLYELVSKKIRKIDYSVTPEGELPHLAGITKENSTKILEQTINDLPSGGTILHANRERIKADIASLPKRNELKFPDESKEFAEKILENDLILANTVVIPRSDTRSVIEFDDGSHIGHKSSIDSPLWDETITFEGIPSWLFELWGKEDTVGDMHMESDDGWSTAKSDYSSDCSNRTSRVSARRLKTKRPIEESRSVIPPAMKVLENVQSAPQLVVRSASQSSPKKVEIKKKRKLGF
jgi:hypothetical protein